MNLTLKETTLLTLVLASIASGAQARSWEMNTLGQLHHSALAASSSASAIALLGDVAPGKSTSVSVARAGMSAQSSSHSTLGISGQSSNATALGISHRFNDSVSGKLAIARDDNGRAPTMLGAGLTYSW